MAMTFSGQRCSDCMGALEFNKKEKIWFCPYCGKQYERDYRLEKVQIDGLAGINELVRITLSDLANNNFSSAKGNLSECEKINANHVGTIIANIAYYLFQALQVNKEEARQFLGKAKYYQTKLITDFKEIYDDEKALYDYIDNPDVYALLYITFSSINDNNREEYLYNYVDFENLINISMNKRMLSISFKEKRLDDVDRIMSNIDYIDKRFTLNEILKKYPDCDKKKDHIKALFDHNAFEAKDVELVKKYLETTTDSSVTRLVVITYAYKKQMTLSMADILKNVLGQCHSTEECKNVFETLNDLKLQREETKIILDYCLSNLVLNLEICKIGLHYLHDSNSLFEVDGEDLISFIKHSTFTSSEKIEVLSEIFSLFTLSNKSMDSIISYALLECNESKEVRFELISKVLTNARTISIKTVEDYLLKVAKDEENKIEIVKLIFKLNVNITFFASILNRYLEVKIDNEKIQQAIIIFLCHMNLKFEAKAISNFIINMNEDMNPMLLDIIRRNSVKPLSSTFDAYFKKINGSKYDEELVNYLLAGNFYVTYQTLEKYLINFKDSESKKKVMVGKMIDNLSDNNYNSNISFNHNGKVIKGNLVQMYLLTATDTKETIFSITKLLMKKIKLADLMVVDNKQIKFKKYLVDNKKTITPELDEICNQLGVYKLFF